MALAGETIIAGKIPGERIATDIDTADSSTYTTTETEVQSVTASLVSGRTYKVCAFTHCNSSVGTDEQNVRIREDNATGTELQSAKVLISGSITLGMQVFLYAEYTAVSTASKTFSLAMQRSTGTGNCFREAAATRPSYFWVDYVSG